MTIFLFIICTVKGKKIEKGKSILRLVLLFFYFLYFSFFFFIFFFVTVSAGVELKIDETPVCGPIGNHQRFGGDAGAWNDQLYKTPRDEREKKNDDDSSQGEKFRLHFALIPSSIGEKKNIITSLTSSSSHPRKKKCILLIASYFILFFFLSVAVWIYLKKKIKRERDGCFYSWRSRSKRKYKHTTQPSRKKKVNIRYLFSADASAWAHNSGALDSTSQSFRLFLSFYFTHIFLIM